MGNKLADVIVNQGGEEFFSRATREQYSLSKQLWEQLMESGIKPSIDDIFNLADYVLLRDPAWISASKGALASIEYERHANVDSTVTAIRSAFDKEDIARYDEAFNIIDKEKKENCTLDDATKGILMQLMAQYRNFSNPSQAQEILLAAQKLNSRVLKPITGIKYEKLQCFTESQGVNIKNYIAQNSFSGDKYLIRTCAILDNLIFDADTTDSFEEAINDVASIIGIHASRPERDGIKGSPDNLWAIGHLEYFVIECKSGVKPDIVSISKSDCAQLLSSKQWFENLYAGNDFKCYPIMIHRVSKFDDAASPDPYMRVMTEQLLSQFKKAIRAFAEAVANSDATNAMEIQKLLTQYKLNGKAIVESYTISAKS